MAEIYEMIIMKLISKCAWIFYVTFVLSMKVTVQCDVTPFSLVDRNKVSEETASKLNVKV